MKLIYHQVTHIALATLLLAAGAVPITAQTAPPSPAAQLKFVRPSLNLAVGDPARQPGDTNAPGQTTNTVVSEIQAQLKSVVSSVEAATKQMADANRAGPKEQAAAVEALTDRIGALATKDLGDDSPFLSQADQLIKKMDAQIKLV